MHNKQKGFTLIELMVTIAVMAIIAMMAAPSFNEINSNQNLKKSTNTLVQDFRKKGNHLKFSFVGF